MKKIKQLIIISLLMLFIPTIMSQNSYYDYYFNVGDTIHGRSPIYHYQWWSENWLSDTNHGLSVQMFISNKYSQYGIDIDSVRGRVFFHDFYLLHGEILRYCYTDEPLNIVGLAASTYVRSSGNNATNDEVYRQEYLRLYDAKTDTFQLLGELQFVNASPKRYIDLDVRETSPIPQYGNIYSAFCCNEAKRVQHEIRPIHEYYFDKPVTVTDSFYVGHTLLSNDDFYWNPEAPTMENRRWFGVFNLSYDTILNGYGDQNYVYHNPCADMGCEIMPEQLYKYRFINNLNYPLDYNLIPTTFVDTLWHWQARPHFMLVFPIIEIDSSWREGPPQYECPPVTNLRIAHQEEGLAVIYWNTHPDHNSWQTCYGPQGTPPDSCAIINCPIQAGTITRLDSCTHYDAYVRAVCYHDSTCYSNWVGPVDIFICDTATGGGEDSLQTNTPLNVLTNIVPNPASKQATVYSSFKISRITVYGINGQPVLDSPMSGLSATLDLRGWVPGLYIVVVHTTAGNAAKKLIVR